MKKFIILGLLLTLVALPLFTSAQNTNSACANLSKIVEVLGLDSSKAKLLGELLGCSNTPQPPSTSWCFDFLEDFGIGAGGKEVKALHTALYKEGFMAEINPDPAYFNEQTAAAVVKFQTRYGISQTGYVGPITRAKLNKLYGCGNNPMPPQGENIKVISPNGGEILRLGTTYHVRNTYNTQNPIMIGYNLYRGDTKLGFLVGRWHVADQDWLWNVGQYQVNDQVITAEPGSNYYIQVYGVGAPNLDRSDSAFTITGSIPGNQPPVIRDVSGPSRLNVGQTGTWKVKASDPENGTLSYSVNWGDAASIANSPNQIATSQQQEATFTHSYASAGNYTVAFTVTDSNGQVAKTSLTVNVGDGSGTPSIIVSGNLGTSGVELTTTDGRVHCDIDNSIYYCSVPAGLSDTIVPRKSGWTFIPTSRIVSNPHNIPDKDFIAIPPPSPTPLQLTYGAHASRNQSSLSAILDGNPGTSWTSDFAPQWVELNVGPSTVSKIRLLTDQSPAGQTTHRIYAGSSPNPQNLVKTISGYTTTDQWLEVDFSPNLSNVQYIRILTTASPSWVAWKEIEVWGVPATVSQVSSQNQVASVNQALGSWLGNLFPRLFGY